ncbi:LOW QUALITY PROTEIN: sperm-associated antigen 6 [Molossus nigricans]
MNLVQPGSYADLRSVCKEPVLPADALPIRVVTLDGARLLRRLGAFGTSRGGVGGCCRRSSPEAGGLRGCGDPRPGHHSPDWVLKFNGRVPVLVGQTRQARRSPASRPAVCGRWEAAGTINQREVLQSKGWCGRPDGWQREPGDDREARSNVSLLAVLEQYQETRTQLVWMVAELATRPHSIETVLNADVMSLLRPLLWDVVSTIQAAALALGRLLIYSDHPADTVVKGDVLPQLVSSMAEQNFYKKVAAFVLAAVGKPSPQLTQAIVDCGAPDALVIYLQDSDPGIKEAAAWALGCIAAQNAELSQAVVDAGAVPLLVLYIPEPDIALKRIAALDVSDISKHSPELAQTVVDAGAIAHLAQMTLNPDAKLKHQVFTILGQIAKHSADLAEIVVEAEIFPAILTCQDKDEYVKKNASSLIRKIAKHTTELMVNTGRVPAEIACIGSCKGKVRLPGILMLGHVAAHSENLAMVVTICRCVCRLSVCLSEEPGHIKAATAGGAQTGRHTAEHSGAVAVTNIQPVLLALYLSTESSEELQVKSKIIKSILQKCTYLPALEPFLYDAPPNILKHVVGQFSKVLLLKAKRRLLVTSGGLKKGQEIKAERSLLQKYISSINCYSEEIISSPLPGQLLPGNSLACSRISEKRSDRVTCVYLSPTRCLETHDAAAWVNAVSQCIPPSILGKRRPGAPAPRGGVWGPPRPSPPVSQPGCPGPRAGAGPVAPAVKLQGPRGPGRAAAPRPPRRGRHKLRGPAEPPAGLFRPEARRRPSPGGGRVGAAGPHFCGRVTCRGSSAAAPAVSLRARTALLPRSRVVGGTPSSAGRERTKRSGVAARGEGRARGRAPPPPRPVTVTLADFIGRTRRKRTRAFCSVAWSGPAALCPPAHRRRGPFSRPRVAARPRRRRGLCPARGAVAKRRLPNGWRRQRARSGHQWQLIEERKKPHFPLTFSQP